MKLVVALGGNALARRGQPLDVATQRRNVQRAARVLAALAEHHELIVTHGNGPQVGLLALQAESHGSPVPLDVLGAESEGMIGYLIEQELSSLLPGRDVATLLTQVEVRADDPAFAAPTKPIGPVYAEAEARRLAAERGFSIGPDGDGFRRLVPSPAPVHVLEMRTIQLLARLGVLVICGGGGGIPVVKREDGALCGVEAVIDKDAAAVLLATHTGADRLLLLTDVPAVYDDWPETRRAVRTASPRALAERSFAAVSMGPKVAAACRFVKQTGNEAHIGALEEAERVLAGQAGTRVRPGVEPIVYWEAAAP